MFCLESSKSHVVCVCRKTGYVVKATTDEEKTDFQVQEKQRFDSPHLAFTYNLHGYRSVVGPVKGVFAKKVDAAKAREHALLVNNRPAFVTILTLGEPCIVLYYCLSENLDAKRTLGEDLSQ